MINYAETYEIVTPESASDGEAADRGFIDEECSGDFRDLVELLEGTEPSSWPPREGDWYTAAIATDYETGAEESRSYHPKTDRDARYMHKAWQVANQ